jgi:hypothetical protein
VDVENLPMSREDGNIFYMKTPNYPNEYSNNIDCNCSMLVDGSAKVSVEILEFDLESSNDNSILSGQVYNSGVLSAATGGTYSLSTNALGEANYGAQQPQLALNSMEKLKLAPANTRYGKLANSIANGNQNAPVCTKDYFSINTNNLKSCGTLNSFVNFNLSIEQYQTAAYVLAQPKLIDFRLRADDALTRRGFWLKIKSTENMKCPENFILVDNACIRIYNNLLTWYEADSYCAELGYQLAMIDNFELDKQLNRALFDNEDNILASSGVTQTHSASQTGASKRFWIGIKHLNETSWFDHNNQVIEFSEDERNWWPWLVVDSHTYNQGSCVAKRRNWFVLDDCYKRLPFACQYVNKHRPKTTAKAARAGLKCGKEWSNLPMSSLTSTKPSKQTTKLTLLKDNSLARTSATIKTVTSQSSIIGKETSTTSSNLKPNDMRLHSYTLQSNSYESSKQTKAATAIATTIENKLTKAALNESNETNYAYWHKKAQLENNKSNSNANDSSN